MRRPGISKISKAHPSVDENMFTVFPLLDADQFRTRAPPLTGLVDDKTDLKEYDYRHQASKNKHSKSKAATPVPVVEQDLADEIDASEPTDNLMNFPPALDPLSTSAYLAVPPRHPSFSPAYEDRGIFIPCPESSTNASPAPTMYQYQEWGSSGRGGGAIGMVRPISLPPQFRSQPGAMPLPLPPFEEPAYPSLPYVASSTHGNAPAPSSSTYVAPSPATYAPSRDRAAEGGASTTRMGSGKAPASRGRRRPPTRRISTNPGQPPTSTTARYTPYPLDSLQQPQNPVPALRRSQVRAGQLERVPAAPAYVYSVPAGPSWASTSTSRLEEQREAGVAIPPGYVPNWQPEATPRRENFVYPPTEVATYSNIPRAIPNQMAPIWTTSSSASARPSPSSSSTFSWAPVLDTASAPAPVASQLVPPPAMYGGLWSPMGADVGSAQAQLRAMMDELYNGGNMNGGGPSGTQPRRP